MESLRRVVWNSCLAALFSALPSCKTIDDTYGLPPFYELHPTPSTFTEEEGTETLVRPLYSREELADGSVRVRSFPPILDFSWTPNENRYWVLPVFLYRSFLYETGTQDIDWFVFPIFFGGTDPTEGAYFAIFPLGGKLKGLLGHDEATFALFPVYWNWRNGERRSTHILWPFYNQVHGGTWSGWRLWPFYGRYRDRTETGEARSDSGFVLWPFFIRRRDELHRTPTETFFTFPFYGRHVNQNSEAHTFLWPLYQYHVNKKTNQRLHAGYLFPFRFTDGQADLWPLAGVKRTSSGKDDGARARETYRHFFLWPIERYSWEKDEALEASRFWLLPLFWHFYYIDRETDGTRREWKLWPLLRYQQDKDVVAVDLISPLWFRRPEFYRFYSRWFNVFRYRWREHVSGWEILYGTIQYRRESPRGEAGALEGHRESIFSILGGLFACGSRDDKFFMRLLYVPWW